MGEHLLAIAIGESEQFGYNNYVIGFCKTEEILQYFVRGHGAIQLRMLHEYQICIFDEAVRKHMGGA